MNLFEQLINILVVGAIVLTVVKLALTLFFLMIGIGLWVRVEGRESLWSTVKRALKPEKEESLDLINALVRPAGARIIVDVLTRNNR